MTLFGLLQSGCIADQQPEVCRVFFDLSSDQRETQIKVFDLDTQLQIQLCGLRRHPIADYSYEIADAGPTIIPKLLERLKMLQESSGEPSSIREENIFVILGVFNGLAVDGVLKGRHELLPELRKAAEKLNSKWMKRPTDKYLQEIEDDVLGRPQRPA